MKYTTYVGAYTGNLRYDGIHVLESDAESGDFRTVNVIDEYRNPIYMALNRDCTRLYAAIDGCKPSARGRDGGLVAFRLDNRGERLTRLNSIATGWTGPCYVALSPDECSLVYAEYACGTAGFAMLKADGSLDEACAGTSGKINPRCQVQHVGVGSNLPRQDRAHAHCAVVTPDGKFLMVVDLTLDRIVAYDFAGMPKPLIPVPSASIDTKAFAPGAGPRHIVFHPNGKLAFVVFELLNLVASFRYTGEGFEHVSVLPLMRDEAAMKGCKAAAIKVSEDGTQVFCSNRDISRHGFDSISVFNLDQTSGKLEFLNNAKLGGAFPRDFEFMPGGRFCLAGLKESWQLASYAYDREKGSFSRLATMEGIHRPLFVKFNLRSAH